MGEGWYQNVEKVMDVMTITDDDDDVGGGALGGGEPKAIVIDNGLQGAATRTRCLH